MKKFIALTFFLVAVLLTYAACAEGASGDWYRGGVDEDGIYDESPSSGKDGGSETGGDDYGEADDPVPGEDGEEDGDPTGNPAPQAGQLTAGEWSDINNYAAYRLLFLNDQDNKEGIFKPYLTTMDLGSRNRIPVSVKSGETAVAGASVKLYDGETVLFSGVTDAKGNAYLYALTAGDGQGFTVKITGEDFTGERAVTYSAGMEPVAFDVTTAAVKPDSLEIMFVIDTTGSMGDELQYLKKEIDDVILSVKEANPDTAITVALLFYRDEGDSYVTRYFDFSGDIELQRQKISEQSAAGGGDFPEAVHTALSQAVAKQWTTGASTKLLIHVADAPPHTNVTSVMQSYGGAIVSAAEKGIRMIPVASSGIDKQTEYLFRNEALLTGGTYVFLTNDSGIGGSHIEPTIGEFTVEYLNALLVRVINGYHTGEFAEPVPYHAQ